MGENLAIVCGQKVELLELPLQVGQSVAMKKQQICVVSLLSAEICNSIKRDAHLRIIF